MHSYCAEQECLLYLCFTDSNNLIFQRIVNETIPHNIIGLFISDNIFPSVQTAFDNENTSRIIKN